MISCHIVRDLLPGYIDGVVSAETAEEIDAHLKECAECKEVFITMKSDLETAAVTATDKKEVDYLKKVKAKARRKLWRNTAIIAGAVVVLFGILTLIFAVGTRPNSRDVEYTAEYSEDSVQIRFTLTNGMALVPWTSWDPEYNNFTLNFRQVPKSIVTEGGNADSSKYTFGIDIGAYREYGIDTHILVRFANPDGEFTINASEFVENPDYKIGPRE